MNHDAILTNYADACNAFAEALTAFNEMRKEHISPDAAAKTAMRLFSLHLGASNRLSPDLAAPRALGGAA